MSDITNYTANGPDNKKELKEALQARLDAYFANQGTTGANFADSCRARAHNVQSSEYNGVSYSFRLDENDSTVCTDSEQKS